VASRAPAAPPRSAAAPAPQVSRTPASEGHHARIAPAAQPAGDSAKRVLIAHPEVAAGKRVADALASWGVAPLLVHDGVEAMLQIQRTLPRVVVLDAALPKMFGFQICEIMKRNEQLRAIPVVLIGAIHDQDRYRRPPEELYGADAYLERHQLPDALAELLTRFGIQTATAAERAPAPVARPAATAVPEPARAARPAAPAAPARPAAPPAAPVSARPAAAAAPSPAGDPEIEKAQRLARIIVSDVILYNPEKFEAAVRAGNVVDALSAELEEGYSLFASRVDSRVCDPREYLQRELVRVARSRGMK
jgi:CheY-like chemotaxis protein